MLSEGGGINIMNEGAGLSFTALARTISTDMSPIEAEMYQITNLLTTTPYEYLSSVPFTSCYEQWTTLSLSDGESAASSGRYWMGDVDTRAMLCGLQEDVIYPFNAAVVFIGVRRLTLHPSTTIGVS